MLLAQPFISLNPLATQEEAEQLEIDIRESFREVFEQMLGDSVHGLLHYGSPHLFKQQPLLKKFYLADGLSLPKANTEIGYLQYLMKAWRVKNQKRGFHFLRTYLQILYPNEFKIEQLWQESGKAYPSVLRNEEEAKASGKPHWRTSRVRITVSDERETGASLAMYHPTFQAILGARFLIELYLLREENLTPINVGVAGVFTATQFMEIQANFERAI